MLWFGNWLTYFSLAVATEGPSTLQPLTVPDFPFWPYLIKILTILSAMVGVLLLGLSIWKRLAPKYQRHPGSHPGFGHSLLGSQAGLDPVAVEEKTFLLASSASNLNVIPLSQGKAGVVPEPLSPPNDAGI